MNVGTIRSGVIAGIIAAAIWTVITLLTGEFSRAYIATWAIIFFLIALVGTVVVSSIVRSRKHDRREPLRNRTM